MLIYVLRRLVGARGPVRRAPGDRVVLDEREVISRVDRLDLHREWELCVLGLEELGHIRGEPRVVNGVREALPGGPGAGHELLRPGQVVLHQRIELWIVRPPPGDRMGHDAAGAVEDELAESLAVGAVGQRLA